MDYYISSEFIKDLSIVERPYLSAVVVYLISALLVYYMKNRIARISILIIAPLISAFLMFYPGNVFLSINGNYFTLPDLFLQILLFISFMSSVLNYDKNSRFHSFIFLITAASIASVSTVNLIQCFFFYFFLCYIPFFTVIDLRGNFKKYSVFLILNFIADLFIIAGVSFFTGEDNFIIKESIKPYILYPLLLKTSFFPVHFVMQSLINKIDFDLYVIYIFNIVFIAVYIIIEKFTGSEVLLYGGCATALYSLLFSIIHNDAKYASIYIFNASIGMLIAVSGLFTDVYSLKITILSVFSGSALFIYTMGEIIRHYGKSYLGDLNGVMIELPYHFILILISSLLLIFFPGISCYLEFQLIIEKLSSNLYWNRIFFYSYLSLMTISISRIIFIFFKEPLDSYEKEYSFTNKGRILPLFSIVIFFILMKYLYFKRYQPDFEIISDYFQIIIVSVILSMMLRNFLYPKRGNFYSMGDITEFLIVINDKVIIPFYKYLENFFDSLLTMHPNLDIKFLRQFDIFEIQIFERLQDMKESLVDFSNEFQKLERLSIRLYAGIGLLITALLVTVLVVIK